MFNLCLLKIGLLIVVGFWRSRVSS